MKMEISAERAYKRVTMLAGGIVWPGREEPLVVAVRGEIESGAVYAEV